MLEEIRHESSFPAMSADGRSHTLYAFVEILDAETFGNPEAEVEGLMRIFDADGQVVNRLEKGRYQIVGEDHILTSDDPAAL